MTYKDETHCSPPLPWGSFTAVKQHVGEKSVIGGW